MSITYTVHVVHSSFNVSKVRSFRDVKAASVHEIDMDKWNSFEVFLTEEEMEEGGCIKEVSLADLVDNLTNHIPEDRSYGLKFDFGNTTVEKEYEPSYFLRHKEYAQGYLNEILPYMVGGFRFILVAG
jgi:hypothetical protein